MRAAENRPPRFLLAPGRGRVDTRAVAHFFTTEDDRWFVPEPLTRGPWDVNACHAGPPSGLLARGLERAIPEKQLARMTVSLMKPIPMAGFALTATVTRTGRATGEAEVEMHDGRDKLIARARGLFLAEVDLGPVPSPELERPRFDEAQPARFPFRPTAHAETSFVDAVEMRAAPGHGDQLGARTMWMRAPPLLPNEPASPVQALCPLADCGNALSRNAESPPYAFLNPDLSLQVARRPVGAWFASRSFCLWDGSGLGLSQAVLFDVEGPVGTASQTIMLRHSG